jgi:murein DD-endopeptidase MepM/ murein hydrolase activator NlpD
MYQKNNSYFPFNATRNRLAQPLLLLTFICFSWFSVLDFAKNSNDSYEEKLTLPLESAAKDQIKELDFDQDDLDDWLGNNSTIQFTLQKNEQINILLSKHRVDQSTILKIIAALKAQGISSKILKKSRVIFSLITHQENHEFFDVLDVNIYNPSNSSQIYITKQNEDFVARESIITLIKSVTKIKTRINNSLFCALKNLDIPLESTNQIINAYSHQIDFQRQIKAGDTIELIIEKYSHPEQEFSHYGAILLAKLNLSNQHYNLYRYGNSVAQGYFSEKGESLKRNLLKTPIKAARISSHFGKRVHPILGYTRMHKGIDFAAPAGTPIYSAGDGIVAEFGSKGGFGNYVKVKHSSHLSTLYAHVSRFHPELKVGARIKQGKTIAYVGSSGISSGAHLHYEVHINGNPVNPLSIKTLSDKALKDKALEDFMRYKNEMQEISKFLDHNENYQLAAI